MPKLLIGPSTGWLYAREIFSIHQQMAFLTSIGVNAVEVHLAGWERNDKRMFSLRVASEAFNGQTFSYRSVHLPDVNNQEPELQLATAKEAIALCAAVTAVTHPLRVKGHYPVKSYRRMIDAGVPLALENMDPRKDSGFDLTELKRLVTSLGCKFVLDAQHAYEHDHSMRYAGDLFESMGNHLIHLHVSGETESNEHSLVHKATNANEIIEFVGRVLSVKNVPIILEGEYTTPEELQQEIRFLTDELN